MLRNQNLDQMTYSEKLRNYVVMQLDILYGTSDAPLHEFDLSQEIIDSLENTSVAQFLECANVNIRARRLVFKRCGLDHCEVTVMRHSVTVSDAYRWYTIASKPETIKKYKSLLFNRAQEVAIGRGTITYRMYHGDLADIMQEVDPVGV